MALRMSYANHSVVALACCVFDVSNTHRTELKTPLGSVPLSATWNRGTGDGLCWGGVTAARREGAETAGLAHVCTKGESEYFRPCAPVGSASRVTAKADTGSR